MSTTRARRCPARARGAPRAAAPSRRTPWLEASAELWETLQPPIEIGRALAEFARAARSMSGATAAAVVRLDNGVPAHTIAPDPPSPVAQALLLVDEEPWSGADSSPVDSILGPFAATPVPPRTHLVAGGLLVLLFETGSPPLSYEERAPVSFADQAALALDRARATEDRAELAVTSDRERIAATCTIFELQRRDRGPSLRADLRRLVAHSRSGVRWS